MKRKNRQNAFLWSDFLLTLKYVNFTFCVVKYKGEIRTQCRRLQKTTLLGAFCTFTEENNQTRTGITGSYLKWSKAENVQANFRKFKNETGGNEFTKVRAKSVRT